MAKEAVEEKDFMVSLGLENEKPEEKEEVKEAEEVDDKSEEAEEKEEENEKIVEESGDEDDVKEKETDDVKEKQELGEEDLTKEEIEKLPKDSRGMYHAMKKEREKRKQIEGELQFLKLQKKYPLKDEKKKDAPEEETENIEDVLKGKNDDDIISVGEIKKILSAQGKKVEKEKESILVKQKEHEEIVKRIDEIENIFKETHSDYDEMFDIFKKAAREIPSLQYEVIAEVKRENGNPAKKVYELGNKFKSLYGKKTEISNPKEEETKRILKNAEKKKSSASVTGQSVSNEALEEMDADELGKTLSNMSMAEFIKVPKKIREKALTI